MAAVANVDASVSKALSPEAEAPLSALHQRLHALAIAWTVDTAPATLHRMGHSIVVRDAKLCGE